MKEEIRLGIEKALSGRPHIFRNDPLRKQIDGCSPGVLSNMDSAGRGPDGAFQIGRKIAYPIDSYVNWVVSRTAAREISK